MYDFCFAESQVVFKSLFSGILSGIQGLLHRQARMALLPSFWEGLRLPVGRGGLVSVVGRPLPLKGGRGRGCRTGIPGRCRTEIWV